MVPACPEQIAIYAGVSQCTSKNVRWDIRTGTQPENQDIDKLLNAVPMSFFVALSPYNILQLLSHVLVQAIIGQTKSSNSTSVHEYNVYISNCFLYAIHAWVHVCGFLHEILHMNFKTSTAESN